MIEVKKAKIVELLLVYCIVGDKKIIFGLLLSCLMNRYMNKV